MTFDEWIARIETELGVDDDHDVDAVLDVARDVAHSVERRAAPVTAFLMGVAVGRGLGDEAQAAATIRSALEGISR